MRETFPTYQEACEALEARKKEAREKKNGNGNGNHIEERTLQEVIDQYLTKFEHQRSIATKRQVMRDFAEWVEDNMGADTLISAITWGRLSEYRGYLRHKPAGRSSLKRSEPTRGSTDTSL